MHYLFIYYLNVRHRNPLNPRVLRHKQGQWLRPRRGGEAPEEFAAAAAETQSHLPGSDRGLRHRPVHGVPQRAGRHCTRALHPILHSYGRVKRPSRPQ